MLRPQFKIWSIFIYSKTFPSRTIGYILGTQIFPALQLVWWAQWSRALRLFIAVVRFMKPCHWTSNMERSTNRPVFWHWTQCVQLNGHWTVKPETIGTNSMRVLSRFYNFFSLNSLYSFRRVKLERSDWFHKYTISLPIYPGGTVFGILGNKKILKCCLFNEKS